MVEFGGEKKKIKPISSDVVIVNRQTAHPQKKKIIHHIGNKKKVSDMIPAVIPEEMEAKRNASGCRFGATGS